MAEPLRLRKNIESLEPRSALALPERLSRLGVSWGWLLAAGIAHIVIGLIAFTWPVRSTFALTLALGVLFIINGLINTVESIKLRKDTGNGWRVFQSVLGLAAGVLVLRYPMGGIVGITIAMTFYFFVSAAAKGVIALGMRPLKGWGWALASATASFLIGVYVIATFPVSALWMPGFLLGVDFVVHGASMIGFSFNLKRFHPRIEEATDRSELKKAA